MTHFKGHEKADICLVSKQGVAYRCRRVNLVARSDFFDNLFSAHSADEAGQLERIGGLPSLKLDCDSEPLDLVLALIHDQPILENIDGAAWIAAYTLAHSYDAEGVEREIKKHLPLEDDAHGPALWRLSVKLNDALLRQATCQHAVTMAFLEDPFGHASEYGVDGLQVAIKCAMQQSQVTLLALARISTELLSPGHEHTLVVDPNHQSRKIAERSIQEAYERLVLQAKQNGRLRTKDLRTFMNSLPVKGCDYTAKSGYRQADAACRLPQLRAAVSMAIYIAEADESELKNKIEAWRMV